MEEVYFRFLAQDEVRVDPDDVGKNWHESWPREDLQFRNSGADPLPVAIEVTLTLHDLGEVRRIFALAVEKQ